MFFGFKNLTEEYNRIIEEGAKTAISNKEFLQKEIAKWKVSPKRQEQITGEKYYNGFHDILLRQRTAVGENGKLITVDNLPNNRIVDNQYQKAVDQKTNFIVGQPITFHSDNEQYNELLQDIFNRKFMRIFKAVCTDCLNGGLAWLYPYYDESGEFCFKRFSAHEILPFWQDSEHTKLDCAVRLYEVNCYEGQTEKVIEKVEVYTAQGVERYVLDNGVLVLDVENPSSDYINIDNTGFNWARIPLIAFRYNYSEIPLIRNAKPLQDSINTMLSDFQNNMQEDSRNTILVLKNYDGENLGEFRRNLATYGAVKVRDDGGVETLSVDVNAENYKAIIEMAKKELISSVKGYDVAELRASGTPNEMNIKSVFNDISMDANSMEIELQAGFDELLWFVNAHLANSGKGSFENEDVEIIFNMDTIVNESQVIEDISKSVGIISDETLIANHPWIDDVEKELARLKKEKEQEAQDYLQPIPEQPIEE